MSIDELLDGLDDMIDNARHVPLSGKLCFVDAEKVRETIDDIRLNLPQEVRQARAIVADRTDIIKNAKEEAEGIIKAAEEKARAIVSQDEIVRAATAKANEIMTEAQARSKEMKKASTEFVDNLLRTTEESINNALGELRQARQVLKAPVKI